MSVFLRQTSRGFGLIVALAAATGAQEKACEVNEGRPNQVARALLAIQVATESQKPDEVAKQLTNAVRLLTENGDRMDNQPGRNFVLGKALVLWAMQPNVAMTSQRGALGFATDAAGEVDLAAAIDSAFRVVETAHPECISETLRWRGQKPWVDLVNSSIEFLALSPDSAERDARRAIMLNPFAPYGYVILAQALQRKNNGSEALAMYRKGIELAARDTIYDDIRRQSLLYLADLNADSAEMAADSTARRPYLAAANEALGQVMSDPNVGALAANARAGLCRVAIITGDTASLRQTYRAPLAAPATFSYGELMNAGVCMARADMIPEATVIFEAAAVQNPWHRDALSNLAIMLVQSNQHEKALPYTARLLTLDPNNEENLQLAVLAYAGKVSRIRTARGGAPATKAGARPAAPRMSAAVNDSLFRIEKAYLDSAVVMTERKEKLAYAVTLTEFNISDQRALVSGIVRNQGTQSKPISVHVDFLDKDGNVLKSQQSELGTIEAGASARFSITAAPGTSVSAFRYRRIE
ncbi:MAG: FxLYD domain-containing protein [Gemmatimonadaceae bacterium]